MLFIDVLFLFLFLLSADGVAAVGVPLGEAPPRLCGLKHITRAVCGGEGGGRGGAVRGGAELQMGEN